MEGQCAVCYGLNFFAPIFYNYFLLILFHFILWRISLDLQKLVPLETMHHVILFNV